MAPAAKFRKTTADVEDVLDAIPNEQRRADARALVALMTEVTGEPAAVWTANIIGFGESRYRYRAAERVSLRSRPSRHAKTASSSTWSAATRNATTGSSPN